MQLWQYFAEIGAMIVICLLFMLNGRQNSKDHAISGFFFGALGFVAFIAYVTDVRRGLL